MNKVIFTADDYGVIPAIDEGIIKAVNAGKINSVAAFSNHHLFESRIKKLQDSCAGKTFEIGCHLTISSGKPISERKIGLLTRQGSLGFRRRKYFKKYTQMRRTKHTTQELNDLHYELSKQVEQFYKYDIEITNLSCHHNTLFFFEDYHQLFFQVAKEFGLVVRSPLNIPKAMNDLYISMVVLRLFDNMSKEDRHRILSHTRNMRSFLSQYEGLPDMPIALNTVHYGPLALPTNRLSNCEIDAYADEKNLALRMELSNDAPEEEVMEYVFHLIDDNYDQIDAYCEQTKFSNSRYTGIDAGYFDSRMAEQRALLNFELSHLVSFESWRNLSRL
ncbi:ChbG/HpnK family deacetylase [Reichenbachiella carrageenanivorans]|uniref:ChbG/HpnK family deacetylase n=1 Tax=Reichenbachiella carrageenanivorans TaxID=2979869 RepID=A0ABY6CX32_9BACT|nr:ChbG/HpnK family deacetylase [Reichenbachiella carrageenanivorans]UXX78428.1 ChbG/HpnK family deacetylase [Reichenbachiella carrageenanivorans]